MANDDRRLASLDGSRADNFGGSLMTELASDSSMSSKGVRGSNRLTGTETLLSANSNAGGGLLSGWEVEEGGLDIGLVCNSISPLSSRSLFSSLPVLSKWLWRQQ